MSSLELTNKALLIIDMQKGSFTLDTPRFDSNNVIKRINKLAKTFRKEGAYVFFIQHNGKKTNEFIPNTTEWELLDELEVKPTDIKIEKYVNDIFYESQLQLKLKELNINELYITGCATDFCIASTIQSALVKNFNITVIEDGHTTGDRPHLTAKKIIEHYNWVWKNMIPTKGTVKVLKLNQIQL